MDEKTNIDIPKQVSGATGYWIGEDDPAPEDALISLFERPHTSMFRG